METRKTNDSVKTGLQIEAGKKVKVTKDSNTNVEGKEIDVDDIVHQPDFEPSAAFNKEKSEQRAAQQSLQANSNNEEKDPDDLVHGNA